MTKFVRINLIELKEKSIRTNFVTRNYLVLIKADITGLSYEITYLISYVQYIYSAFKVKKMHRVVCKQLLHIYL